jgi:hypothetical protein
MKISYATAKEKIKKFYNRNEKQILTEIVMLLLLLAILSLLLFVPSVRNPEAPKIDLGKYLILQSQEKKFPQGTPVPPPVEPTIVQQPVVQITPVNSDWRPLVAKYFPAEQVDNALAIMNAESGGNPSAVSPTNDHGLFQINAGTWPGYADGLPLEMAYDAETNIRVASYIYNTRGWSPWTTARKLGLI